MIIYYYTKISEISIHSNENRFKNFIGVKENRTYNLEEVIFLAKNLKC